MNGNLFERLTDYASQGADKLAFTRYYNSQSGLSSSLGTGWRSNFDRSRYRRLLGKQNG